MREDCAANTKEISTEITFLNKSSPYIKPKREYVELE